MRGHSHFSLVKANDAPAHRGNILLRTGDDSSRFLRSKPRHVVRGTNGNVHEEAFLHIEITLLPMCSLKAESFGRSESPQVSPLPEAKFLVSKRRIAPHRPRLSRGGGVGEIKR